MGQLNPTSIKYKVERDERYLPYIDLGRWLCSNSIKYNVSRHRHYIYEYNFPVAEQRHDFWSAALSCLILKSTMSFYQ